MINKLMCAALTSALSFSVHAGMMGGDLNNAGFIAMEGGYVVNSIKNFNYSFLGSPLALVSVKEDKKYGGRIGAGMLAMMDDQNAITSEIGWGYYGQTTLSALSGDLEALSVKYTLTGFDVLIGIAYIQPSYSLSFKGGALIQNLERQTNAAFADPTFPSFFSFNAKSNQTAALPEVKVGGSYNFDTNWALTAAFFYAVGTSTDDGGIFDATSFTANLSSNTRNPSVGGLLLGVQYTC